MFSFGSLICFVLFFFIQSSKILEMSHCYGIQYGWNRKYGIQRISWRLKFCSVQTKSRREGVFVYAPSFIPNSKFPLRCFLKCFRSDLNVFSRNMDTRPSFSLQFLVQFWKLHLIFYSNQLSIFVFFLFIGSSCLYTFLGYRVGLISGEIDNEIRFFIEHSSTMSRKFLQSFSGSRPWPVFADMSFKHRPGCGNIDHKVRLEEQKQQLHITCLRSGKNFLARRLMVLWRRSLTSYMQKLYIHGHNFYKVEKQEQFIPSPRFHCQLCEGGGEIDNPDQRLTSDVSSMLTSYERLMEDDLFILPASTAYYAYKV